jgi:hypothetical protein
MITLLTLLFACSRALNPDASRPPPGADTDAAPDSPTVDEPAPVEPCPFDMSATQILVGANTFRGDYRIPPTNDVDLVMFGAESRYLPVQPSQRTRPELLGEVWTVEGSARTTDGTSVIIPPTIGNFWSLDGQPLQGSGWIRDVSAGSLYMHFAPAFRHGPESGAFVCSCDLRLDLDLRLYPSDYPQCVIEGAWRNLRLTINDSMDGAVRHAGSFQPCTQVDAPPTFPGATVVTRACDAWVVPGGTTASPGPADTSTP